MSCGGGGGYSTRNCINRDRCDLSSRRPRVKATGSFPIYMYSLIYRVFVGIAWANIHTKWTPSKFSCPYFRKKICPLHNQFEGAGSQQQQGEFYPVAHHSSVYQQQPFFFSPPWLGPQGQPIIPAGSPYLACGGGQGIQGSYVVPHAGPGPQDQPHQHQQQRHECPVKVCSQVLFLFLFTV